MKKIEIPDLKNLHEYELIRDDWRRDIIAVKARRRVLVGPTMSLVFENRLTVLNQVQEMCRAERIVRPDAVQAECDVYNELLPRLGEVAATLFVEIPKIEDVQPELDKLIGMDDGKSLWLEVGGSRAYAQFVEGQGREDRIAAVQYVRFPVGEGQGVRDALLNPSVPVAIVVDHPNYRFRAEVPADTRRELANDLAED
jgi:hypothetical protein